MSEFSVSDYGIFNDGVKSINTLIDKLGSIQSDLSTAKTTLNSDSVFMGPICDNCVEKFGKIDTSVKSIVSNYSKIGKYLTDTALEYDESDTKSKIKVIGFENGELAITEKDNVVLTGENVVNGKILDTTNPVYMGNKYQLTDDDYAYLGYIAKREQGSISGAKLELSLMANLFESKGKNYSSITNYVRNSGWFASSQSYSYPGDEYVQAAKEVIGNGKRYLTSNIVEHDCISDITSISTGSKSSRDNYIPGETIIHNRNGATYKFVGFAPDGGDPFGYLV